MRKITCLILALAMSASFVYAADRVTPGADPYEPPSQLRFDPGIVYAPGKAITIMEGWNLIAMPVIPDSPYSIEQFISDVELYSKSSGVVEPILNRYSTATGGQRSLWKVLVVAVYRDGLFVPYPQEGLTYFMVPGEAYFAYAEFYGPKRSVGDISSLNVPISGSIPASSVVLNIGHGWNGASIATIQQPAGVTWANPITTLSEFSAALARQRIAAKRILFWSREQQAWEGYALSALTTDRPLRVDEGFLLYCDENGLFVPSIDFGNK